MLDKIKNFGSQVAGEAMQKANSAVDGITSSVKGGVESITSAAVSVTDALNEKAVRSSTAQACNILELAIKELKTRPLANRPLTLKASVDFQLAALEIEVNLTPADFAQVPEEAKALPAGSEGGGS